MRSSAVVTCLVFGMLSASGSGASVSGSVDELSRRALSDITDGEPSRLSDAMSESVVWSLFRTGNGLVGIRMEYHPWMLETHLLAYRFRNLYGFFMSEGYENITSDAQTSYSGIPFCLVQIVGDAFRATHRGAKEDTIAMIVCSDDEVSMVRPVTADIPGSCPTSVREIVRAFLFPK